ncbi:hypothetical protein MKX01_039651, partial [Papaver californicum]
MQIGRAHTLYNSSFSFLVFEFVCQTLLVYVFNWIINLWEFCAAGNLTNNRVPWRGPSGLKDGNSINVKGGLVGGYYDAGNNMKCNFPMAFSMSMLSWSVIEYSHKYKSMGEYHHIREIIKWGTDYLLLSFNSSATKIDKIFSQ